MMSTDRMSAIVNGLTFENKELKYAQKLNIWFGLHIGSGTYSHVYKAKYKSAPVVLKVCDNTGPVKRLVNKESVVIDILKEKPHKNIIKFLEKFENSDSTQIWILMEWFQGMDLAEKLMRRGSPFEEKLAKYYFKQLVEGIRFLHSLAIVHRDIKLDNLLIGLETGLSSNGQQRETIKIIDFGFAKKVELKEGDDSAICNSILGTEVYMAPEMLSYKDNKDYDAFKSDIFSLAIVLFALLFNSFPDRQINTNDWSEAQLKPIVFPEDNKVSESVKQLILGMSCEDSGQRLNINQILDSEWMRSTD